MHAVTKSTLTEQQEIHFLRLSPTGRSIWEPKLKMGLQHNTYSLQQSTHTEDLFWVSGEA